MAPWPRAQTTGRRRGSPSAWTGSHCEHESSTHGPTLAIAVLRLHTRRSVAPVRHPLPWAMAQRTSPSLSAGSSKHEAHPRWTPDASAPPRPAPVSSAAAGCFLIALSFVDAIRKLGNFGTNFIELITLYNYNYV